LTAQAPKVTNEDRNDFPIPEQTAEEDLFAILAYDHQAGGRDKVNAGRKKNVHGREGRHGGAERNN
jgi:hypothetical protein